MSAASDDLTPLLVPPNPPSLQYSQAVIKSWDPSTFSNVLTWHGGARLVDVPVLAGTDALTYRPGDVVGLLGWDAGGGKGAIHWWVLGRLVLPGTGRGEEAISWMQQSLGESIARQVISETIHSQTAENSVIYNANTTGFDTITGGPVLADVEIQTGKLIVMMTMQCLVQDIASLYFGHRLTGPETIEPSQEQSAFIRGRVATSTVRNPMFSTTYTNLTPGTYTIEARALVEDIQSVPVDDVELGPRSLIAIAY